MLQSSLGRKWKKCETTLLFIAMHYRGYTSLEVKGRWGLLLPPCLLIIAVQQPGTSSPPSRLKRSSTGVILMCKSSFTNNSCPLPWSSTVVSSQLIGWWCSHACSATADFSIIPFSHRTESPPGLKDYSDVKFPANTPDVLTHPSHVGYHTPISSEKVKCWSFRMPLSGVKSFANITSHSLHSHGYSWDTLVFDERSTIPDSCRTVSTSLQRYSFFMRQKFPSTMRVWPTSMNGSVIVLFLPVELSTLDNRERIYSYFGLHNYLREGGKTLHARNVVQDNDVSLKWQHLDHVLLIHLDRYFLTHWTDDSLAAGFHHYIFRTVVLSKELWSTVVQPAEHGMELAAFEQNRKCDGSMKDYQRELEKSQLNDNVRTLAVSHRVLAFEACSACPASKILRWALAGYSGLVVRWLSRGKCIILCESPAQRALNGTCFS